MSMHKLLFHMGVAMGAAQVQWAKGTKLFAPKFLSRHEGSMHVGPLSLSLLLALRFQTSFLLLKSTKKLNF